MDKFADKAVHNLSFGQKKRVCIAGVLAMLDDLHARGITLLLATHDIDFAYAWADRIHLMSAGRCVASVDAGSLAEDGEVLTRVGLRLPAVVELERKLRSSGLLASGKSPRSQRELLQLLEPNSFAKDVL